MKSPIRVPHFRIRNARQSEAASCSASVFEHEVDIYSHGRHAHRKYLGGLGGEYRLLEVPFCECAMQRQSEAASDSASVFKHEVDVSGHGGHAHRGYLGRPGGEYRLLEVPFCECAM